MSDFFVGQNSGLIILCRLAALVGSGVALWYAWHRDYPKHDETPGRAFIFATLLAVGILSLLREVGLMGAKTYSDLIVPAASMGYVAHALGAFLAVRAIRFRDEYLRPQPTALSQAIEEPPEDDDQVIRLD